MAGESVRQNPCCCVSLKSGSLFIGVLEIIGYVICTVLAALALIGLTYVYTFPLDSSSGMPSEVFGTLVVLTITIILSLIGFILGIVLVSGVTRESSRILMSYLTLKVLLLSVLIAIAIVCLFTGAKSYLVIENLIDAEFNQSSLQNQLGSNSGIVKQLVQFCHYLTLTMYSANILACLCNVYTIFVTHAYFRYLKDQWKLAHLNVNYPPFSLDQRYCYNNPYYMYDDDHFMY